MTVNNPRFSRRDFLKVAGLGLGSLAFNPFKFEPRVEPLRGDNPHTYTPLFPNKLWAGMYIKPDGQLDRVERPAQYFQEKLDEEIKVNVTWKAAQPEKPEFPDHCTVRFSNGENAEVPIRMMKTVVLEASSNLQIEAARLDKGDAPNLIAVYDNQSKAVLITDLQGNVVRVQPAPAYWEKKLVEEDRYRTFIPYETNGGQKLTGPKGIALISVVDDKGEQIGSSSQHLLKNTNSVKVLLPLPLPFVNQLA